MARATRASGLETRAARGRLPIGDARHWVLIGEGLSLGYRKGAKARRWYARFTDPEGVELLSQETGRGGGREVGVYVAADASLGGRRHRGISGRSIRPGTG